jgi:small subunit ribosomal protein S18
VCTDRIEHVDYKDTGFLRRFMSERGKIKSRANTGTCVQHQSDVAIAIKTAREMALLPYAVRTAMGNKGGGRRGRDSGPGRDGPRPGGPRPERPAGAGDQPAAASTAPAGAEGGADTTDPPAAEVAVAVAAAAPGEQVD